MLTRSRSTRGLFAAVALACLAATTAVGAGRAASLPGTPAVPPQPRSNTQLPPAPPSPPSTSGPWAGPAAAACSFAALGSSEVRNVYDHPFSDTDPASSWWWGPSLAVDPADPCHMYMTSNRTTSANAGGAPATTVLRGDIQGTNLSFAPDFTAPSPPEDTVEGLSGAGLLVYGLAPPAPVAVGAGSVWLPEMPNVQAKETRVYRTADTGATWAEADSGLVLDSGGGYRSRALVSHADPHTAYLIIDQGSDVVSPLLFVTTDDGAVWSPRALPAIDGQHVSLAVDPTNSGDLYLITDRAEGSNVSPPTATMWLSTNGGLTWMLNASSVGAFSSCLGATSAGAQAPYAYVDQFFVTHASAQGPLLYAHCNSNQGRWFQTSDLGTTWTPLPLPVDMGIRSASCEFRGVPCIYASGSYLIADPSNPDILLWTDGGSASTTDSGLDVVATTDGFRGSPLRHLTFAPPPNQFIGVDALQVDDTGQFFVAMDRTTAPKNAPPNFFIPLGDQWPTVGDDIVALRASSLVGQTLSVTNPVPPPPPTSVPTRIPAEPLEQPVADCSLNLPVTGGSGSGGSATFDGRFLDFTEDTVPGVVARATIAGSSCTSVAPLVLDPRDYPGGNPPQLWALTYDAVGGVILGAGVPGADPRLPSTYSPVYAIDPVNGHFRLFSSVDTADSNTCAQPYLPQGSQQVDCSEVSFFSWDMFRNGLWAVADPAGVYFDPAPGFIPKGAQWQSDCFTQEWANIWTQSKNHQDMWSVSPAAAVVGGDGYLYVQAEDDVTVLKQDARTCQVVGGFSHQDIGENPQEDEQIACDALSFSTPVMWIRNAASSDMLAYPASDAYCPFPTRLTYTTGPVTAAPGAPVTLCFTLEGYRAGQWNTLSGQSVNVSLAGSQFGRARTNASGSACVNGRAPATAGRRSVQGRFPGTSAYLPSEADGTLTVLPISADQTQQQEVHVAAVPPPPPPPHPPSESVFQGQPQVQAQADVQAQAQSQSQSQAQATTQVQPGVMTQRRRQEQVATQSATTMPAHQELLAQVLRRPRGSVAPLQPIAAALLLGVGLLLRRPALRLARRSGPRRNPRLDGLH